MKSTDILITFIVNHGDAYDVMTIAREAGARGGTIVNAHGTSREGDVKFFGMNLMSEKEMLIILAEKDLGQKILNAVGEMELFKKPGGGIKSSSFTSWLTSAAASFSIQEIIPCICPAPTTATIFFAGAADAIASASAEDFASAESSAVVADVADAAGSVEVQIFEAR